MISLLLLIVGLSVLLPVTAAAQSELPAVQFGLVGVARGETARLNVVNTLPPSTPPDPCVVTLQFLNELGEPFRGAVVETDLDAGQATHLDLPAATAFESSTALRRRFSASVETSTGPATANVPPSPCAGVVSTLELFDNLTGRLVALYPPGPSRPPEFNPGPPDTYGMLGLARLQSALLTVLNLAPAPTDSGPTACRVSLTFLDEAGQMFSSGRTLLQRQVDLMPGQFASLTLSSSLVFSTSRDLRQAFRASVEASPGPPELPPGPCRGLISTLELIDTLTGRTQLIYSAESNPGPAQ